MKNKNLSGGLFAAKPTPLAIKETSLSAQIAEYLRNRNLWVERLNCGKVETKNGNWIYLCERGTPDRITILRGQAVFIETKTYGEKPTKEQTAKHEELRASGAIVIVANSFNSFIFQFNEIRAQIESAQGRKENLYD